MAKKIFGGLKDCRILNITWVSYGKYGKVPSQFYSSAYITFYNINLNKWFRIFMSIPPVIAITDFIVVELPTRAERFIKYHNCNCSFKKEDGETWKGPH